MPLTDIQENLRFLTIEVTKQVEDARKALRDTSVDLSEKVADRDDYIDTLKAIIENRVFSRVMEDSRVGKQQRDFLHAISIIASNLENIADSAAHVVGQLRFFGTDEKRAILKGYDHEPFFETILGALQVVPDALMGRKVSDALRICRAEFEVDRRYEQTVQQIMAALQEGGDPAALVTVLFIFRDLEEICDALLNIGEAVIFSVTGEKIKVHQYHALGEAIDVDEEHLADSLKRFESIWGSRSGCRIGRLPVASVNKSGVHRLTGGPTGGPDTSGHQTRWVIFKEGKAHKLIKEKESCEFWETLRPGLPPKVLGYHEHGENASILLEFLPGTTFQALQFEGEDETLAVAYNALARLLSGIYRDTRDPGCADAKFLGQLARRVADVFQVHPEFDTPGARIGDLQSRPFAELVEDARRATAGLVAPFRVRIHGDLNLDNVMFEEGTGDLHFIDLHRSEMTDFAQDISVFLVSHFRLPAFEPAIRSRLDDGMTAVADWACGLAQSFEDHTFQARLALGLIRSFFTSTRFELNEHHAQTMYMRSVYLLERVLDHAGKPWEDFRLPMQILVY